MGRGRPGWQNPDQATGDGAGSGMGQVINVDVLEGTDPATITLVLDRGLTGQGIREFTDPAQATGDRPEERLTRELFATGGVDSVHVYGNNVVIAKTPTGSWADIKPKAVSAARNLFVYYDVNRV